MWGQLTVCVAVFAAVFVRTSEPIPECLKVFDSREAYPGEDITLSVVAVGQNFVTSGGFVNAQLLLSNDSVWANVGGQQQYQVVEPHSCNNLTYNGEVSFQ